METKTKIGSDPNHTAWCLQQTRKAVKEVDKRLGSTRGLLVGEVYRALVLEKILGIVNLQHNEDSPIWRVQELIQVAHRLLETVTS